MKTSIRTIILATASIFAAMSCQKETTVPGTQDRVTTGETIQVNINASLGDLVAADGTKATAESVIRLKWAGTETDPEYVKAYCGTNLISTGDGLKAIASENGLFAKLSGEITTTGLTSGTSVITFVYSNVNNIAATNEAPTFDFSSQDANIPFVAYATLVYDGTAALTDKMVEFKFATSVMKIAATNLGGGTISTATISGINTKVTLAPSESGSPTITGGMESPAKTITTTTNIDAPSDGTRAIITVGLVPDNNKGRNIAISQTGYTNKGVITTTEIKSNTSYTTPTSLFPCGTLGTGTDAHDYVLIAGTKWATQNLAITDSGKKKWKGGNTDAVTVPGTIYPTVVGDYFQWGASYPGYGIITDADKKPENLLIYTSFTNTQCVDDTGADGFVFKTNDNKPYIFNKDTKFESDNVTVKYPGISPYYDKTDKKYTKYSTDRAPLEYSDDAARIILGEPWRMPTQAEFKKMIAATYWEWDNTDKGYYVYAPTSGDEGGCNRKKSDKSDISGSYAKADALLFFPATGGTSNENLQYPGQLGYYLSSVLYPGLQDFSAACSLSLNSTQRKYESSKSSRYSGCSIRPVSD